MSQIQAISRNDVDLICAAQVIPSIPIALKELIENSLDAGATNIDVRLVNHGVDLFEVKDNGSGVAAEDIMQLTKGHFTSKLSSFQDLDEVSTFGFRGEALSSLCTVGKMTILTKHRTSKMGTKVDYNVNGKVERSKHVAAQVGTTVTIENIFEETFPVRRKSLIKNAKKEFVKILSLLHQYSLCTLNVRISVIHCKNGKRESILNISEKSSVRDKIVNIFGPEQARNLIEVEEFTVHADGFSIGGFISTCCHGAGKSHNRHQFFFVQNRPVDLKSGAKIINEIYHQFNRNQYPFFVFKVSSRTSGKIDVNLTPDKRKILIEREMDLWQALKEKLQSLFEKLAPPKIESLSRLQKKISIKEISNPAVEEKGEPIPIEKPYTLPTQPKQILEEKPKLSKVIDPNSIKIGQVNHHEPYFAHKLADGWPSITFVF